MCRKKCRIRRLLTKSCRRSAEIVTKKVNKKKADQKIQDALDILNALGLPRQQLNDRSALTLLSLLALEPETGWADASNPLMGITPMMDFFSEHYGKKYAPNTRETVRRQTVHQFLQAALIVANPDKPARPTNSPKAVYQIEPSALKLLKNFGTPQWKENLEKYLRTVQTLKKRYDQEREMQRLPIKLADGQEIKLSPGGHNILVKKIIENFCSLFTPGGQIIYIGDTQLKWSFYDAKAIGCTWCQNRRTRQNARCCCASREEKLAGAD